MTRAKKPAWKKSETAICSLLGEKHVGGNAPYDCEGDDSLTEVKHHRRNVGSRVVEKIARQAKKRGKSKARVVSTGTGGFTQGARQASKRHNVELIDGVPRAKARKRSRAKKPSTAKKIVAVGALVAMVLGGYKLLSRST